MNGEILRAGKNIVYTVENTWKGDAKSGANLLTKGAMWVIKNEDKAAVLKLGSNINQLGITATQK